MKKNRFILSILMFVNIVLLVIMGWLYMRNPLGKIYSFPLDTIYSSCGEIAKSYYSQGLIFSFITIISILLFWKNAIKRILFIILATLILIIHYFIV